MFSIYIALKRCYYWFMKGKRVVYLICIIVIAGLLGISLTSCLKIGMKESNVRNRLSDAGVTVRYERTSPMTIEGQNGYKIGDILHGTMTITETVVGETAEREENVYVFFAGDTRSADWVENVSKKYIEDNADVLSHWNVYRFEEVVAVGYYKLVAIVRQY